MSAADSERILILAPFGRDATLAEAALRSAGLAATACQDIDALRDAIAAGAGAVLIAEEALPAGRDEPPEAWIGTEPLWSALPFIVLVSRAGSRHSARVLRGLECRANVSFLERPVPRRTLVSNLRMALESRRRQYAARDMLEERSRLLEQLDARLAELQTLYDAAPIGLAMVDREMRFRRVNQVLAKINGVPASAHIGKVAWDVVPDLRRVAEGPIRQVFETGESAGGIELTGETPARPGDSRIWVESYYPIKSGDGRIEGVGIVVEEVTEQRRAAARQALLTRELNHRVKNMLATVQSIAHQTARSCESMEEFERTLSGRLTALARGHDLLLRSEWQSTSLANVLERTLFPFLTQGQATLDSADVPLTPRAALAFNLILHELATNASKYGALSVPEGRLDVRCEKRAGDAKTAEFIWVERGGPPVNPPRRQGFGSKLIERCARYELTGEVQLAYEPAGFKCEIRFPLGG